MTNINILSYILSFIGFGTSAETKKETESPSCSFLSASTCIVNHPDEQDEKSLMRERYDGLDWLNQLSNATLCQILTSAISNYPPLADHIQSYYRFGKKDHHQDIWLSELISLSQKAKKIAHSLDHCRISEQFSRATEIAVSLHRLLSRFTQDVSLHGPSHVALFGLILIAQESLSTPTEVRQQMFSHDKFGRVLILEMTSVLKNFKMPLLSNSDWFRVSGKEEDWLVVLEQACLKMARYDITWEYRREYQDVPTIAARYYKHYAH